MKSPFTPLAALLAVLGIEDLAMVPVMVQAHSQPPQAAIVLSGLLGVATLATIPGVLQGRRWAFWAALACRVIDAANSLLGALFGPEPVFKIVGWIALVLSVAAIALLVRNRSRSAATVAAGA
jgi:hypothetical protein